MNNSYRKGSLSPGDPHTPNRLSLSPEEREVWDKLCAKIAEDLTPGEMDRAAPGR